MNDEIAYVVGGFCKRLAAWRGRRIVLHGTREYAQAIIECMDAEFNFVAVVCEEWEGRSFCGKEVWREARLVDECPDAVILTERVRHAEEVYQRIGALCRSKGIALLDMYGLDWISIRSKIDAQVPQTLGGWLALTDPYDVVVFELPDTVLARESDAPGRHLVPRMRMARLVRGLLEKGKEVLYIGRGPYTRQELEQSLETSGLIPEGTDVSDVFFMRAGEDGSWHEIRSRFPHERVINIGHGIPKECILPRYYGVETYRMLFDEPARGGISIACTEANIRAALDPPRLRGELEEALANCDIISFDVFDTLLVRDVLFPRDVFSIVEEKALEREMPVRGFASVRSTSRANDIGGIYREVQDRMGLSDSERDELLHLELEVEEGIIRPREALCEVFSKAIELGKRVFLVSDMYLPGEMLRGILERRGIVGFEGLFVSCDHNCSKRGGLLELLADLGTSPSKVAHIGDCILYDLEPAADLGMRAVLVPSPLDLAKAHGFGGQIRDAKKLEERLFLGTLVAKEFVDPFVPRGLRTALGRGGDSPLSFDERAMLHVADYDHGVPSELRRALLAWYPFQGKDARSLFLGADEEALVPLLEGYHGRVDLELDPDAQYDRIVIADVIEGEKTLRDMVRRLHAALRPNGTLLLTHRNRLGVSYLCGGVDDVVAEPFSSLDEKTSLYSRHEMVELLEGVGFKRVRTFAIMPDASFAQAVYTDEYMPESSIKDRVMPREPGGGPLVAAERDLYGPFVKEGMLMGVANCYLHECRKAADRPTDDDKDILHVTLSLDRGEEHSFITTLLSDGTVTKRATYPAGAKALEYAYWHGVELQRNGVAVVGQQLVGDKVVMPFVDDPPLLVHLEGLLPEDAGAFIGVFDRIWSDILRSSATCTIDDAKALRVWGAPAASLGPVLERGYIDMVPYNAFWVDGEPCYFDQEFVKERCPASYVMFRALHYTWIHLPKAEEAVSLESLKRRFSLDGLWDAFLKVEERFLSKSRNRDLYGKLYPWQAPDAAAIRRRRRLLLDSAREDASEGKTYETGLLMGVFDLFHVGHLRLIRRSKERCAHLRVGVVADEVVERVKGITPTIPQDQRMEIVGAISDVDEVVLIEGDTSRIREWEIRPFDCFFSGDDYGEDENWEWEKTELEKRGATIEFFPYTQEQSSSKIRKALAEGTALRS